MNKNMLRIYNILEKSKKLHLTVPICNLDSPFHGQHLEGPQICNDKVTASCRATPLYLLEADIMMAGGDGGPTGYPTSDLLRFDAAAGAWNRLRTSGARPSPRTDAAMAAADGAIWVHGGAGAGGQSPLLIRCVFAAVGWVCAAWFRRSKRCRDSRAASLLRDRRDSCRDAAVTAPPPPLRIY